MPSKVARAGAPSHPEQINRMRFPCPARRLKISNRWISAPPAWGFARSCQLTRRMFTGSARVPHLQPAEGARDAVENAVDETRCPGVTEPMGQMNRFIDGDFGWNLSPAELVDTQPKNVALDHGDPAHPPVLRRPRGFGIEGLHVRHDAGRQRLGPIEDTGLGAGEASKTTGDSGNGRRSLQFPSVKNLER